MLNDGAWLRRQLMNNAYMMKKQNGNAEIVMRTEPLLYAILNPSS